MEKRHQVAITDPNVMRFYAKQNNITDIKQIPYSLGKKELVLAFRKGKDNIKRIKLLEKLLKNKN
jgi:hypothetical protein